MKHAFIIEVRLQLKNRLSHLTSRGYLTPAEPAYCVCQRATRSLCFLLCSSVAHDFYTPFFNRPTTSFLPFFSGREELM